ncbi:MAG: outer membrane beta-barrel protein [Bacteroidota bacterium]
MKKILLFAVLIVAFNSANAQMAYGLKAGLNYNLADIDADNGLSEAMDPENAFGFHAGAFVRMKIPILGLYVQAEPTFTRLNVKVNDPLSDILNSETTTLSTNRFDLPVLVGWKMLGMVRLYGGPVASWNLGSKLSSESIDIVVKENMSIGGQAGVGVELGSILVDARYEFAVKHNLAAEEFPEVNFDNRGSQIILGLAYKF